MDSNASRLSDEAGVSALILDLARQVESGRDPGAPLVLIGVKTRGVPIAQRLAESLRRSLGDEVPVGAVDITLYRDDLGKGHAWPVLKGTEIPFAVDGAEVVLVDDVLYTGRTVRAALNCVCDLGRPAAVRLAVLVDRGGRELPIRADYVGLDVSGRDSGRVKVRVRPIDPADEIIHAASSPTRP